MKNILVVDSHQEYARYLTAHLVEEGYQVTAAFSCAEAIEKIKFTIFSLIFLDLEVEMAQINAMEFLEYIKRLYPEIPVIVISGHDSRELAVEAARRGAYDFLVCSLEEIRFVLRKSLERRRLGIKNKQRNPFENPKKIFEHFYTTKESGTGRGLAAANQTIQAHNGYIEVQSEVNKGTTFMLYLPVSKE